GQQAAIVGDPYRSGTIVQFDRPDDVADVDRSGAVLDVERQSFRHPHIQVHARAFIERPARIPEPPVESRATAVSFQTQDKVFLDDLTGFIRIRIRYFDGRNDQDAIGAGDAANVQAACSGLDFE